MAKCERITKKWIQIRNSVEIPRNGFRFETALRYQEMDSDSKQRVIRIYDLKAGEASVLHNPGMAWSKWHSNFQPLWVRFDAHAVLWWHKCKVCNICKPKPSTTGELIALVGKSDARCNFASKDNLQPSTKKVKLTRHIDTDM